MGCAILNTRRNATGPNLFATSFEKQNRNMSDVAIAKGRTPGPFGVKFKLYVPRKSRAGCVILAHGFGGSPRMYSRLAKEICDRVGVVVFVPQLTDLLGGRRFTRDCLRERCGHVFASHIDYLVERSETMGDILHDSVKWGSIMLAGHSAGGAVAFEAACALPKGSIKGLLLLDAVPWQRTLRMAEGKRLLEQDRGIMVLSLRAPPSSVNHYGLVTDLLLKALGPNENLNESETTVHDMVIRHAKHGDFATNFGTGILSSRLFPALGCISAGKARRDLIIELCEQFIGAVFVNEGQLQPFLSCCDSKHTDLERRGLEEARKSLPDKVNKMPLYLKQ